MFNSYNNSLHLRRTNGLGPWLVTVIPKSHVHSSLTWICLQSSVSSSVSCGSIRAPDILGTKIRFCILVIFHTQHKGDDECTLHHHQDNHEDSLAFHLHFVSPVFNFCYTCFQHTYSTYTIGEIWYFQLTLGIPLLTFTRGTVFFFAICILCNHWGLKYFLVLNASYRLIVFVNEIH